MQVRRLLEGLIAAQKLEGLITAQGEQRRAKDGTPYRAMNVGLASMTVVREARKVKGKAARRADKRRRRQAREQLSRVLGVSFDPAQVRELERRLGPGYVVVDEVAPMPTYRELEGGGVVFPAAPTLEKAQLDAMLETRDCRVEAARAPVLVLEGGLRGGKAAALRAAIEAQS